MTVTSAVGALAAIVVVVVVLRLVVMGRLRAKYAGLWLIVGVVLVVLGVVPGTLTGVSTLLGFAVPANLMFFFGFVLLLLVSIHLSLAVTRLENHVQRLAEEVAILSEGRDRTPPTQP